MQETIIELRHANIYQGNNLVLQDVNLHVNRGGIRIPGWKNRHR